MSAGKFWSLLAMCEINDLLGPKGHSLVMLYFSNITDG